MKGLSGRRLSGPQLSLLQVYAQSGGVPDCWVLPILKLIDNVRSARSEVAELRTMVRALKRVNRGLLAELAKEHE